MNADSPTAFASISDQSAFITTAHPGKHIIMQVRASAGSRVSMQTLTCLLVGYGSLRVK